LICDVWYVIRKEMDRRDQLQLLPGTKKRLGIKVKGENRFLYIGSAILGAVIVSMFALGRYQTNLEDQLTQVNDQISIVEKSRKKSEEVGLKVLQQRLSLISELIDSHTYWTKGLTSIAGLMQNDVRLESFSGDANLGSIGIAVQASSYAALARQVASFLTESAISDLSFGKTNTTSEGLVETSITIKFNREFIKNSKK